VNSVVKKCLALAEGAKNFRVLKTVTLQDSHWLKFSNRTDYEPNQDICQHDTS
jgi:hypothetical protein